MENTTPSASPIDIPVMQRDAHLEALSDKIRKGDPVGFLEAIAAINYQEHLRAEREALRSKTFLGRLLRWFRAA
jgi:hypothetical protein